MDKARLDNVVDDIKVWVEKKRREQCGRLGFGLQLGASLFLRPLISMLIWTTWPAL